MQPPAIADKTAGPHTPIAQSVDAEPGRIDATGQESGATTTTAPALAAADWQSRLESCRRDPVYGYPVEEGPFLHLMLSQHVYDDAFALSLDRLTRKQRVNPRGIELTSDQRQDLGRILAAQVAAHEGLRSEFLTLLDSSYHESVDRVDYLAIATSVAESPEARALLIDNAKSQVAEKWGREGVDTFVMLASLMRPGLVRDHALIYVSRATNSHVFQLWDEMRVVMQSVTDTATQYFGGL